MERTGLGHRRVSALKALLTLAMLLSGSGCGRDRTPQTLQQSIGVAPDGDINISTQNVILNKYLALSQDLRKGDSEITISPLELFGLGLSVGDLLLIIQMQGAQIKIPTDPQDRSYGEVTDLGSAGLFEFIRVAGIDQEGKIFLDKTCGGGLRNSYLAEGKIQLIRVPQYRDVNIQGNGSVTAPPWNGSVGGVIALRARSSIIVRGFIEASGLGFRGGSTDYVSGDPAADQLAYYGAVSAVGGEKGEGIAGSAAAYDVVGGRFGRGAPANGGGGGNSFRGGGGGGGGAGSLASWNGYGVMSLLVDGAIQAWPLDPGYQANGGARTSSTGGGRGGYTHSANALLPRQVAPGAAGWGGNLRRDRGGLGGRPMPHLARATADLPARLFLGGGGGAGDADAMSAGAGAGGRGGGIIYISSPVILGAGKIAANGSPGGAAQLGAISGGGGGGGGGGVVVLDTTRVDDPILSVQANGGVGGSHGNILSVEGAGPGGGGGGGLLGIPMGVSPTTSNAGGASGLTTIPAMNQPTQGFSVNGATQGQAGLISRLDGTVSGCFPIDLTVSIDNNEVGIIPGTTIPYQIRVTNLGPYDVSGVRVQSTSASPMGMGTKWTCQVSVPADVQKEAVSCGATGGSGAVDTIAVLPASATATIELNVVVPENSSGPLEIGVSAAAPATSTDINLTNNVAKDTDPVYLYPALRISGSADPERPKLNTPFRYVFRVQNTGRQKADGLRVAISLAQGTKVLEAPSGAGWTCTLDSELTATCQLPSLGPNEGSEIAMSASYQENIDSFTAFATLSSDSPELELIDNSTFVATSRQREDVATRGGGIGCSVPAGTSAPRDIWVLLLPTVLLALRRRGRPRTRLGFSSPDPIGIGGGPGVCSLAPGRRRRRERRATASLA